MKRVAHVRVQPAVVRAARGELCEDSRAEQCDDATGDPYRHDRDAVGDVMRDDRGVHEDARTDDAAHDDQRCIAFAEQPREFRRVHYRENADGTAKWRIMLMIAALLV